MSEKKKFEIKVECMFQLEAEDLDAAEDEVEDRLHDLFNIECVEFYVPICKQIKP